MAPEKLTFPVNLQEISCGDERLGSGAQLVSFVILIASLEGKYGSFRLSCWWDFLLVSPIFVVQNQL